MRLLHLSGVIALLAVVASCQPDDPSFADAAVDAVPDVPIDLTAPETNITQSPALLTNVAEARFEFTSSQSDATFRCSTDGSAAALCSSPFMMVATEGEHTFTVFAVSAAQVADETPATHTWRVDLTPPETTITAAPAALDNSVNTEIAFSASETATFSCTRDGGAAAACTSPFAVMGLTDGAHTVTVRATDEAGNVEVDPATHTWTVDTTAPDTVIDSGPTGFVAAATARFTFSSPNAGAGAVYSCALDTTTFATCSSPRDLTGLTEGAHTFQVRVRDAVGNMDPTPASRTWTVDTIAPTVSITGGPSGPTNDNTPVFTFTTAGSPTATECRIDTAAFAACSATYTPLALGEGAHTFEVRVTDAAGNTGNATRAFTVDTMPPTVTITGGPMGSTGDNTPTFTFTTAGSPSTIACAVGGQSGACTTTFTPTALADGSYTFSVTVTDAAGNTGMASRSFVVDTGAPTVTITAGPTGPTNDNTPTFTFTTAGMPATTTCTIGAQSAPCASGSFTPTALTDGNYTFTVTVADDAGNMGSATRSFSVDTVAPTATITGGPSGATNDNTPMFTFTTAGSPATTTCSVGGQTGACTTSFTPTALVDGSYTFTVTVTDAAGNTGTATRTFSVDTAAPTATITGGPTGPTNDPTPTFTFTTAGSPTTITCSVGGQTGACTTTFTPTALVDGSYTFTVTVTDAAGNSGSATRTFAVDTAGPTATITGGPTGSTNDNTPTFTFTTAGSPTTTTCTVGMQMAPCTGNFTPTALVDGSYTFTVTVTDAAGNSGSATRSFSVDTVAPTATITGGPNGPTNVATPTFTFTTAGSPTTITCSVGGQSGACTTSFTPTALVDGSYTFTVTVSDAAGNSGSATRSFSVDTAAPTVSITGGPNSATNDNTPTFTFTTGGSPTTITCSVGGQSGACTTSFTPTALGDGNYTFTVTVSDAAGNSGSATRSFSVDTVAPTVTITAPAAGAVTNDNTPTFTFTTGGSPTTITCAVGGQTGACTTSYTPTALSDGAYTFTVSVADAAGNSGSATRSITVDTAAPTVTITAPAAGTATNDNTPTFTFTTGGSPTTITCSVGGQTGACTTSFTPTALTDGAYTFTVTVADDAGNSASATRSITIDTVAPTVTITGGPGGPQAPPTNDNTPTFTFTTGGSPTSTVCTIGAQSGACSGSYTSTALTDGSYTFTVAVFDAAGNSGSASRAFSVDATPPTVTITGGPNGATNNPSPIFTFTTGGSPTSTICSAANQSAACSGSFQVSQVPDGSYTFTVTVTDAAGNSASASRNFTVDTSPPNVDITGGPSGATNDNTPTFTFVTSGSPTSTICAVGNQSVSCGSPFTAAALADGGYAFSVTVSDAAGNSRTAWRQFSVDTAGPTIVINGGPTQTVYSTTATFRSTASGSYDYVECRNYRVGSTPPSQWFSCATPSYTYNVQFPVYPPDTFAQWTFEIRVRDVAGNSGSSTWNYWTGIII